MIRVIFLLLVTGFTFYYAGWNKGFDTGLASKQDDDIIRGKVTCSYTTSKKSCKADGN